MQAHIFILILSLIFGCLASITYQPVFAQVDVDKDLAVVSINRYVEQIPPGTVYVFNGNYSLVKILESPENPTTGQNYGDITYKPDQIILSTPVKEIKKTDSESLIRVGAVSIFESHSGDLIKTIWNPEYSLTPEYSGAFGSDITFVGDSIVIGDKQNDVDGVHAAGTIYIYDDAGNLQNSINNPDPTEDANFGVSLSSLEDKIIVGISGKTIDENVQAGSISILDSKTGNVLKNIKNPNPTPNASFGYSLDIENAKLIASAPFTSINDKKNVGEVYMFDVISGDLLKTIRNPEPDEGDMFGETVFFANGKIIVGATGNGLSDEGSVFIFDAESGRLLNTIHSPQRIPNSGLYSNEFGTSIAIDGNRLAVGDPHGTVEDIKTGIVYVFDITSGELLQTIDNPILGLGDGFGYALEFVKNMEPSLDILETIQQKNNIVSKLKLSENSFNKEVNSKNETDIHVKKIEWINENDADYIIGGIGSIKLENQELNVHEDLIETHEVRVWSSTDKHGIPVTLIEDGADTGVFYANIYLSSTKSSPLRIHVSVGDLMTVSFEDRITDKPITDTVKISSKYLAPFQQLKNGIPIDEILCDDQYKLFIKENRKPFCLKEKTYEILIQRGYF